MVSGIDLTMSLDCMDTQIQIRPSVDQKSTFKYYFSLGSSMISWSRRKKSCVAFSMTKVEYVAACEVSKEAIWIQKLFSRLSSLGLGVTCIWCDNQSCMKLSKNLVFHDMSKHIEIKYYYIEDML
jgi:hypothetical protein